MNIEDDIMSWLEFYNQLGVIVIPAVYGAKRPEVDWKLYQEARPKDSEIRKWFEDGRQHNFAIICGKISKNLVVLDFDSPEVYRDFFGKYEELEKRTLVVRTSKGVHVYLRTDRPIESRKFLDQKFEVHSDGTIVIAPPSLHPSGVRYEFVNPRAKQILEVGADEFESALEKWLQTRDAVAERRVTRKTDAVLERDYPCWVALSRGVFKGHRDEACFALARHLRDKGLAKDVVTTVLLEWRKRVEQPRGDEFHERDVRAKVESAFSKKYGSGCSIIRKHWRELCSENCPLRRRRKWSITISG